jgi:methionine-rich copper-binding protein CopC
MMRRLLLLCIAGLTVFTPPLASAHVEIVSSYPEQYANVNPIPTSVWTYHSTVIYPWCAKKKNNNKKKKNLKRQRGSLAFSNSHRR